MTPGVAIQCRPWRVAFVTGVLLAFACLVTAHARTAVLSTGLYSSRGHRCQLLCDDRPHPDPHGSVWGRRTTTKAESRHLGTSRQTERHGNLSSIRFRTAAQIEGDCLFRTVRAGRPSIRHTGYSLILRL